MQSPSTIDRLAPQGIPAGAVTYTPREIWDLGYRNLVPIVPPDAQIAPSSILAKKVGTDRDPRGKVPGQRGSDGLWRALAKWTEFRATVEDVDRWTADGIGVGILTGPLGDGTSLVATDADVTEPKLASRIAELVGKGFPGGLPTRIGRAPKALYLARVGGEMPYLCIDLPEGQRVELLTNGRQFVACGVHPKTLRPYHWTTPLPRLEDLAPLARESIYGAL